MESSKSIFQTLNAIDVSSKLKQKNKMNYLPWSSAWEFIKTAYPKATYKVLKDERTGNNYFTDNHTCWVEVEITIEDETQTESLAVMDFKNAAISAENVTSTEVNKAQKRCLVKCAALFGLGLNLWYGEELSDEAKAAKKSAETASKKAAATLKIKIDAIIAECGAVIKAGADKEEVYNVIEAVSGNKNPKSIEDEEVADAVLEAVKKMGVKK